jgi:DNA-3-methyladenine glycosylase
LTEPLARSFFARSVH